jgi:phage terminase large subunit-like protein
MSFVALRDVDGREVRVNPAAVSLLKPLEGGRTMVCLGHEAHAVVVEQGLDEVEALLASEDPPPPLDPTLALVS